MSNQPYTNGDWKLFRSKIGGWQENYMQKLLGEYAALLSGDGAPSAKFWALDRRMREDKKSPGVQLRAYRSSDLIFNIVSLLNDGAIERDDLADFSDELKETVAFFCGDKR